MKFIFTCFLLCLFSFFRHSYGQVTQGLIGHWKLDGNTADSSGNGLHGTANNAIPYTGINGQPNTAYLFNGTSANIGVPFNSMMNVSRFSVATTLQVRGFYAGTCQVSYILARGTVHTSGAYGMYMSDNPFDNGDCSAFDSTKFVFGGSGSYGMTEVDVQYTPTIQTYKWYRVVVTYDSTMYRIYVDGQLVNTATSNRSPIGSSTAGIKIGSHFDVASLFPYWFNGVIDDIRLYNRVLADSEIVTMGCNQFLTAQPQDSSVNTGTPATFTVAINSSITGTYRWQLDAGGGFGDITNAAAYSGFNTSVLTVLNPTIAMSNFKYRCIVSNNIGCNDTSVAAVLNVMTNTGLSESYTEDVVTVFPNPSKGEFRVFADRDISADVLDMFGKKVCPTMKFGKGEHAVKIVVANGIYLIKLQDEKSKRIRIKKLIVE